MITVRVETEAVARAEHPEDWLAEIGEAVVASTKERFARAEAPDGTPWAPLAPATIARKGHARILIGETGALSSTIFYEVGPRRVEIGSPMIYAAVHQFGAKKGAFGRTRRGRPIPFGDIPARPFLGLSAGDEDTILTIVRDAIAGAV